MKDGVLSVEWRDRVLGIDNAQLSRVLVGMSHEAHLIEYTAQGPDVLRLVYGEVLIQIQHLWRTVHGCRLLGYRGIHTMSIVTADSSKK